MFTRRKPFRVLLFLIALSLVLMNTAYAAIQPDATEANALKELHIFMGNGNDFALDAKPTRIETAVILLRLIGKEKEALDAKPAQPFEDVPPWATAQIGYLYQNGLVKGMSEKKFGTDTTDFNQTMTFLLRAVGYSDAKGDFTWDKAAKAALDLSVITPRCYEKVCESADFTRRDLVGCIMCALQAKLKNSQDTLIKKLLDENRITQQQIRNTGILDLLSAAGSVQVNVNHCYLNQEFTITPSSANAHALIRVNVPDDYLNRQKVLGHQYSIQPTSYVYDDGGLYAIFDIRNVTEPTVLKITTEVNAYEYDLTTAQNCSFPVQLSAEDRVKYTSPTKWIESDNPVFTSANLGFKQSDSELNKVQDMMNYVLQHMSVQVTDTDITALAAITNGKGDCFEYSEVLAALCRANKIPARVDICDRINATAAGHAVTEVFIDGLGWVPFDPVNIATGWESFNSITHRFVYLSDNMHGSFMNGIDYYNWNCWGCTVGSIKESFSS